MRAAEAQTRAALLDAAEEAFLSGPWEQASLEAIARVAGVTKQTLLRHFGSKDGLLERVLRARNRRSAEQRLGAPTNDIAGAVDNLLDHYETRGGRAMRSSNLDLDGPLADLGASRSPVSLRLGRARLRRVADRLSAAERRRAARGADRDLRRPHLVDAHPRSRLSRAEVRATLILTINRLLGEDQ